MWLAVVFIFHWSVRSGMCSIASCSVECVCKVCLGFCINSGDQQWKANHRDVASISKTRVLPPAHKQHACCALRRYDSTYMG